MENKLDMDLVLLAQKGEARAFDLLVHRYQAKILRLAYRYVNDVDTALDLVQDIFFKVFRNLKSFKGEASFSTWIHRVTVNYCIDHQRKQKAHLESSLEGIHALGLDIPDRRKDHNVADTVHAKLEREALRKALQELNPDQKMVIVMKIYQDMTFEGIAEILDEPVSTVKSRLYKALEVLGRSVRRRHVIEGSKL